ncbi:MAG TPA: hypothetical protein VFQ95_04865 [Rhodanobacteraceae bacterium]|nr:hypothetical protein [Rhodanobacteraceae bacterium]
MNTDALAPSCLCALTFENFYGNVASATKIKLHISKTGLGVEMLNR